ncbi:MAG: NADP-dependent malic enzyme [Alphaproteobacteria bacterium]|nr:NADP-dependent malic enzyme [Alphaproteobacteria bacterium]
MDSDSTKSLAEAALDYHQHPTPGKIAIAPTKQLQNQRDLTLAYSPGVAFACTAIKDDPHAAARLTARANLVAVVTNGTAVLGLGDIGPLAAKPVMEGKAVLFKKFAGIDVFDIELAEKDPAKLAAIVAALEPTFGGINLEDVKAPECFEVERLCRERMKIPVFHDDQHGTAICVSAAVMNALRVVGKEIGQVRIVASGAGAAGLATLDLLCALGARRENVTVCDILGVVYRGRAELMDPHKARYAVDTKARKLDEVIGGADLFIGLSAPKVLSGAMVAKMAERPVILALANPEPEIRPEEARAARPDAVIATGRSDYPNQVNNVLVFPFIFRGALDVGATVINEPMKLAAARAIAELAWAESSDIVASAYGGESGLSFGPEYLIPKPFDPRLIVKVAPAVAKAAMESGVATRPLPDLDAYRLQLSQFVYRSGMAMRPLFLKVRGKGVRLAFAEGEDERVLRAAQIVVDEELGRPILIGRRRVVERKCKSLGLRIQIGGDVELTDPESDPRFRQYWTTYHGLMARRGVSPDRARTLVRTRTSVIAALMVHLGDADAMISGVDSPYLRQVRHVLDVIGLKPGVRQTAALQLMVLDSGLLFLCDTHVNDDPSAEQLADIALMAVEEVRRFGIEPRIALVSSSNFGTNDHPSSVKMREATEILKRLDPRLEVDGEMHADSALSPEVRARVNPGSTLKGPANLLIMPNKDAGNISFNLIKALGEGVSVGPMLLGIRRPAHVMTTAVTVRGLVNIAAVAALEALDQAAKG